MWWMSNVVDVRCGGCHFLPMVWWMSSVVDVWCGECPFLAMVWWMSGVVDVCVVDVVQSFLQTEMFYRGMHCICHLGQRGLNATQPHLNLFKI